MPIDYTHEHTSRQIMRADAVKTPINPDSGGAISATDGTTTVDPATSIVFPAGTLSDLGAGEAGVALVVHLLGPYRVNFDDPNIQQANNGINVSGSVVIPVGAFILRTMVMPVTQWVAPTDVAHISVNAAPVNQAFALPLADLPSASGGISPGVSYSNPVDADSATLGQFVQLVDGAAAVWVRARDATSGAVLDAGSSDVYVMIAVAS